MVPIATMSEAEVIALQARPLPVNAVTSWLFGTVAAGGGGDRPGRARAWG